MENLYGLGTSAIGLSGNALNNLIYGNGAANKINGGAGRDTLYGGAGKGTFVFNNKPVAFGNDNLADFRLADHTISLENAIFTKLKTGKLASSASWTGARAHDSSDRIVHDIKKGYIYYDGNGSAACGLVLIATVKAGTKLSYTDFVMT